MLAGSSRLIDYSDTDDENEDNKEMEKQIPGNKLPLPATVKNLFRDENLINIDDSSLHDGRTRSFPHERGNWTTLIYIPYEINKEIYIDICNSMIAQCVHIGCLKPCDKLHISLSRTVVLRHHWIDSFTESICNRLTSLKKFSVALDCLDVYCNDERTRTFVGFTVSNGYDQIMTCVHRINTCLSEFRLPPFYEDASFHVSLIWCLGDKEKQLRDMLPRLERCLIDLEDASEYRKQFVRCVTCKIGNRVYNIGLNG